MIKNILIYHHDDADGFWSAATVINAFSSGNVIFKTYAVNYGKEDQVNPEDIEWADIVYCLDFTFDNMPDIVALAGSKLVWIDHHKTAMEKFPDLWNDTNILGTRSIEKAACMLTWEYMYPQTYPPLVIKYVSDRDTWKFEYDGTKAFCAAESLMIHDLTDPYVERLLNSHIETIQKFYKIGDLLLTAQAHRVEKAFDRGIDCVFVDGNDRYTARVVNTTEDISEIGEFIYQKPEYDLAIMWQAIGDKVIFSLRSNSKDPNAPDCAKIAEKYGGGGHRHSAGASVQNTDFILNYLR